MNKRFVMLFILLFAAQILFVVEPVFSSVAKPSVPEFALKLEAHPYYVPPTYLIDPYTGENTTSKKGYTVENKTVIITIKNQEFTSSFNGTNYYFYYNVRTKGHFEEEWTTLYTLYSYNNEKDYPPMSGSEYTVITISADDYPAGGQVDFQVEALLYRDALVRVYDHIMDAVGHLEPGKALYDRSGWSETQTIKIDIPDSTTNSEIPEQTETDSETQQPDTEPEQLDWLPLIVAVALILIPIAAGLGLLIYINKRKHSS